MSRDVCPGFELGARSLGEPASARRTRGAGIEHLLDLGNQNVGEARLGDERIAPCLARTLRVSRERVTGKGDDGDVLRAVVLLEAARRLPAVDARKRQVHQHEVGEQLECLVERLETC